MVIMSGKMENFTSDNFRKMYFTAKEKYIMKMVELLREYGRMGQMFMLKI